MTTKSDSTKIAVPERATRQNLATRQAVLMAVYFLMIISPLLVLLFTPHAPGRAFFRDFSVSLAYVGMAMMGFQLVPIARIPFMANSFPLDSLYTMHKRLSVISFLLVLSHPLILFAFNPKTLVLLNVFDTPLKTAAGVFGLLGLFLVVFSSVLRKEIRFNYDAWKVFHFIVSIGMIAFSFVHIYGINYYTSYPAMKILWAFLGVVWAFMVIYLHVLTPIRLAKTPFEVAEIRPECSQSYTLSLKPVGHPGMDFRAGQVAWITIRRSPFAFRKHPFSITSSAERKDRLEFTIKELGDLTSTIKDLKPGDRVYVDGPYGILDIDDPTIPGFVLVAGGIGSAPVMSILRTMADRRDRRPVVFFYGSPKEDCIIFGEELEELKKRLNLELVHVLEHPDMDCWNGECGYVTMDVLKRHLPENYKDFTYFMCGPIPMLDSVERSLAKLGVSDKKIHSEHFDMV
ncbi:MAG TPA: oxidoreductase [Chloroflexi bacterium]|nr:oxidoreductase [Chloroflexota bacterium]